MSDLPHLDGLEGRDLTETQIQALLAQIDLNIANLLREGKLAALKYHGGGSLPAADRAANLQALLAARQYYAQLLQSLPAWRLAQASCEEELRL